MSPQAIARAKKGWETKTDAITWREVAEMLGVNYNTLRRDVWDYKRHLSTPPPVEKRALRNGRRRVLLRAAVFDIEVTDFNSVGYQGYFIAGCILGVDEDEALTTHITFNEHGQDERALNAYLKALCEYDILIGHNIHAFDLNWLHSRAMHYRLEWPRAWVTFDTFQVAKALAIKSYKGLAALCDYFAVPCVKTSIYPHSWHNVRSPDEAVFNEALADIVFHCEEDVKANRELFDVMYPYAMTLYNNPFKMSKWKVGVRAALDKAA